METIISFLLALIAALGLYPKTGFVVEADRVEDRIVIEDATGNLWEMEGVEDWEIGDGASMIMYDNGTPENIYDDMIVNCRYNGFYR